MPIAPVNQVFTPEARDFAPPPNQELGEEQFLTLLMTQLSNQDPLSPMESVEFMDQISSLNTVKQLMDANDQLGQLMLALTSLNNETAVNLVGREVLAKGDGIQHRKSASHELIFELDAAAEDVTVTVFNANGEVEWSEDYSERAAGEQRVTWNGFDDEGNALPAGDYTFVVTAEDANENPVGATTYVHGIVDELRFDHGLPMLYVNGQELSLDSILRVLNNGGDGSLSDSGYGDDPSDALSNATNPTTPPTGNATPIGDLFPTIEGL